MPGDPKYQVFQVRNNRSTRTRFTIGRLMVAVAVVAVLLAWLDPRAVLALIGLARRSTFRPLAVPVAWLAGYLALMWDPLGVLNWYVD